jgi:hypothetical protein
MVNNYVVIVPIIIAIIAVALGVAYQTGALDPIIEKIGVYYFKAEAKAEEKKMEAQGMTEGEDFLKGEWCRGSFCCISHSWMNLDRVFQLWMRHRDDEEAICKFHDVKSYADLRVL